MEKCVTVSLKNNQNLKEFLSINSKSHCDIDVASGHSFIDGKSLLGLLSLDLMNPLKVFLIGDTEKVSAVEKQYRSSDIIAEV